MGMKLTINRISELKARYYALAPSDRRALAILAGFLAIAFFVLLVLIPSSRYRATGEQRYQAQRSLLAWMTDNAALARIVPPESTTSGESLLAVVDRAAKESGISLQRYEPLASGGVRLYMEGVVFEDVLSWLATLSQTSGIEVAQISVDKGDRAGLVNVRLDLN
jgi:general secretion pathway protein M